MSDTFNYGQCTNGITMDVKLAELEKIDFDAEVEGSNEDYFIRPTITLTSFGEPHARYGIFNRKTGLQEAESYQLVTAKQYATRLSELLHGKDNVTTLPGLEAPTSVN